jgi:ABC-type dipeptide/oligopeptide/nickel transport system permease subunit
MTNNQLPELIESAEADPTHAVGTGSSIKSKSPSRIAWDRLKRDPLAIICALVVLFFIIIAVFAPLICRILGIDPNTTNFDLIDQYGFPTILQTREHPFGIEPGIGRDLLARWLYGARPSLLIALMATVLSTVLGTLLGISSGYIGGTFDRVISWIVDFFLSLPVLLLVIAISPIVALHFADDSETLSKVRLWTLICIFGVFGWTGLCRLIRAQVLSLREREFVMAARAIGVPSSRIILRELLPNVTGQIIVFMSLSLPGYVAAEAGLSFLGIGLVEPTASWGRTIAAATPYYQNFPIYFWYPALGILFLVLSLNLLGDAIRDAFDPKTRR